MKRPPPKPLLRARFEIDLDLEDTRGADGSPIRIGSVVECPVRLSAALGVDVPARVGRVAGAYSRSASGPVILDAWGPSGLYSLPAAECVAARESRLESPAGSDAKRGKKRRKVSPE